MVPGVVLRNHARTGIVMSLTHDRGD